MPVLSLAGETSGTGYACRLLVARLFGRGFDSPRLHQIRPGLGVPSEARSAEPRASSSPMFYCYILECSDRSFYVGLSDDPSRRLHEHNDGKGSEWTAARRPVKLVWKEEHETLSSARQRENQLKRWSHSNKAKLVGGSPRLRSGQTQSQDG